MTDRPRRVAIIGTRGYPSYYGGFETAVRMLAPYLADEGFEVTVYSRPEAVVLDDPARDPRVTVRFTAGLDGKSLSTLTYGLTAVARAARERPDVVLVMNVANGFWLPLLRLRGIPSAVNVDGLEWRREKWGRLARTVFRLGARATARWATEIVCDAHAIADVWRAEFGRESHFIPYGGSSAPALPIPDRLPDGGYVLLVSRFVPENTVVEFFEAARIVARQHPVVIVGSTGHGGELDEAARALADAEPNVHVLGHVSDDQVLFALWQHAGVYFHGHTVGGTNPALVQAMALGAPVVARDTVFNREVLGAEGRYVGADPEGIAAALLAVLDDPAERDRLRRCSLDRVAGDYTWDLVNQRYAQVLRDLADRSSKG